MLHLGFPRLLTNLRPVLILIFNCGYATLNVGNATLNVSYTFSFLLCIIQMWDFDVLWKPCLISTLRLIFWFFFGLTGPMSIVFFSFPFPEVAALPETWFYPEFILFKENVLLHTSTEYHSHQNCLYGCHSHCALCPLRC